MAAPPTDPSSEDTRRAAGLYARLVSRAPAPSSVPTPPAVNVSYVPFSLARTQPPTRPPAPAVPSPPPSSAVLAEVSVPDEPFGPGRWNAALDWSLSATGCRAAFVLSAQGLVVAVRGDMPEENVELVGARLLVALAHVQRIRVGTSPLCSLTLDFGDSVLTVVTVGTGEQGLVLGLIGPAAIPPRTRDAVASVLEGQVE